MRAILISLAAVAVLGACAHARAVVPQNVPAAQWGGDHIDMQVTSAGAQIDFDCAHGAITGTLSVAKDGTFVAKGTYGAEHPGPVRDDGPPDQKATYSGTITGDAMTLRVVIEGQDQHGLAFQLVRNQPGNVRKCR